MKNRILSCVFALMKCVRKSSSPTSEPMSPFPPRFCTLKLEGMTRLMYPLWDIVMIVSSFGIRSSSLNSFRPEAITFVFLASPYLSLISLNSFLTTFRIFAGLFRRICSSAIVFFSSLSSSSIFCRSSAAKVCRRISRIAVA